MVPVPGQPSTYYFAQAFPGWSSYVQGVPNGLTSYNQLAMSITAFSIVDSNYSNISGLPGGLIQGNYTAVLMAGISGALQPADATIAQTGLVPAGTESLRFKALFDSSGPLSSFGVTLGGQTLSLVPLESGANYTLYAADISAWAGQTAELDFTAFPDTQHFDDAYLYLDSIQFSNLPTPEPNVFALSALGALLIGWRALQRRR